MRLGPWALALSFLLVPHFAGGAFADGRENPFVSPNSAEQEQAKQDERIRKIIMDATPEIEARVMKNVTSSIESVETKVNKRFEEVSAQKSSTNGAPVPPGLPGGVIPGAPTNTGKDSKKPGDDKDAPKFISCVNGKALYRDKDNTLFQVSGVGANGVDPCSR